MTSTDGNGAGPKLGAETAKELAKYGITRVPADYFHIGGFHYTNLKDAVAEAKREQLPS